MKKWVKISLWVLVIIGIVIIANEYTNKEINKCVEAGNDRNYCEKGLY